MKNITISKCLIYGFIAIISIFFLLPVLLVLIVSFSSEASITRNGYTFFPDEWSLSAYQMLFGPSSTIWQSYWVTAVSMVVGTLIAVIITYLAAYALANPHCKYRNGLSLFFYFPMVFTTGMIPWYMMSVKLGFYDNILALIIPTMIFSPFNLFLVRNFTRGIPESLRESALLDGAREFYICVRIYLPLCMPVIATVALFYAINYWNNYFNSIMLVIDEDYYTLQTWLFRIQEQIAVMDTFGSDSGVASPRENFKMASAIVTMGPIVLLYPFLQRYFVKGIIIGAVKG